MFTRKGKYRLFKGDPVHGHFSAQKGRRLEGVDDLSDSQQAELMAQKIS